MGNINIVTVSLRSKLWLRDFLELAICYLLIMLVIWRPHPTQRFLFWIAFGWILATTLIRRLDADALGLRLPGLRPSLWITGCGLLSGAVAVSIALELHTLRPLYGAGPLGLHVAGYFLWALEQQFILQDYFLMRLLRILPSQSLAIATAAALFSAAHLPNPLLTMASLAWGVVACTLFQRYRNLYALGIVHGILGLCVAISIPDAVTHHMMVGLGYLRYHH